MTSGSQLKLNLPRLPGPTTLIQRASITITENFHVVLSLILEWGHLENKWSKSSDPDKCKAPRVWQPWRGRTAPTGCSCWALLVIKPGRSCWDLFSKSQNYKNSLWACAYLCGLTAIFLGKYSTDRKHSRDGSSDSDQSETVYPNVCYWEQREVWYCKNTAGLGFLLGTQ